MEEINVPYTKSYDSMGVLINPIDKIYKNEHKNRAGRRLFLQKSRFMNNRKTSQMIIIGGTRFKKTRQIIVNGHGRVKHITHLNAK